RGEIVIVVAGAGSASGQAEAADPAAVLADARSRVDALVAAGAPRSDAARQVAAETGLPRREPYGGSPNS
ncbi:MAG: hypothetical protein ABUL57_02725, partial [Chloroflexota bacterium]